MLGGDAVYNSKIGWCYICNQGWVSIVRTIENLHYCICEECETEWDSPENFFSKNGGTHFKYSSAIYLDDEDIENCRWKNYIMGQD